MRRIVVGLLLVLVFLAVPTVLPQETDSGADLVVTRIDVVGPEPVWVEQRPMNNTTIEITVENHGDTETTYTIAYAWRSDGRTTPLNGEEKNSTDVSESPLGEGERTHHRAPWRLQERQIGEGQIIATVDAHGPETNERNDRRSRSIFVERHALDLEIDQRTLDLPADGTRFFQANATNPGNVPENVSLAILDLEAGANARLNETLAPSRLRVDSDQTRSATAYVTWPFTGDSSAFSTTYTIQARATVSNGLRTVTMIRNATGPTIQDRTIENHSAYRQGFDFAIERKGGGTLFGDPNATVQTSMVLQNTGDRRDSYRFAARASPGWAVHLDRNRSGLEPGDATILTAQIEAPDNATPGAPAGLTVRACSDNLVPASRQSCRRADPGTGVASVHIPVRYPGPVLDVEKLNPSPTPAYVRDSLNLTVGLHNPGNRPTPKGTNLTVRLTGPNATDIQRNRSVGRVGAGERRRIAIPLGQVSEPGTYRLEANWSSLDDGLPPSRQTTQVRVRDPMFNLTAPPELTGGPGERVRYTLSPHAFQVTNEGNTTETLQVVARAVSGRAVLLGPKRVTLSPGRNRTIPVAHDLPSPIGATQQATLEVEANLAARPLFAWTARTTTNISDTTPPSARLIGDYPSSWTVGQPLELRANVTDNGGLSRVVALVNGPDGSSTPIAFDRAVRDHVWTASLRPTARGNYSVRIRAQDMANHTTTVKALEIDVRAIPPPEIAIKGPDNGSKMAPNDTLTVRVDDDRPVRLAVRAVRDGETIMTKQLPVSDGRAQIPLSSLQPGPVRFEVRAVNDAGAYSVANRTLVIAEPASDAPPNGTQKRRGPASGLFLPSEGAVLTAMALVTSAVIWAPVVSRRRRAR